MASLGEATLDTGVDLKGMQAGLRKGEGIAKRWSSGVGNLIKTGIKAGLVGVGVAAAGAIAFLGKSVMEAGDFAETLSKAQVTFGDSLSGTRAELDEYAKATGRSRSELLGLATDQGAVIKALGGSDEQAAQMSSTMTQLASDVGSFNNLPTDDVANRFTRALTGEFESLKALGIVINQTALEQELLNMGVEEGVNEVDALTKAQAVQNIIMAQTADAQGDAARTSDSFNNQMIALKSALKDARIEIGTALMPVVLPLVQSFVAFAQDVLPELVTRFQNEVVPALQRAGVWIRDVLLPAIRDLWMQIQTHLQPVLRTISTWLGEKLPVAIAFLKQNSDEVKGALIAIGAVLGGALVLGAIGAVISAIAAISLPIVAVIALAALLGAAWAGNWGGIREKTAAARDFLVAAFQFLSQKLEFFVSQWKLIFKAFKQAFSGDWRGFGETLREVWDNAWKKIKEIGEATWDAIKNFFTNTDFGAVGKGILEGIAKGITGGLQLIRDAAVAAATAALEAAKGFLGIDSPSSVAFDEIGFPTGEGQALGWEAGLLETLNAGAALDANAPAVASGGGAGMGGEMHLHVGVLVADEASLRELELTLEQYRQTEAERRGL